MKVFAVLGSRNPEGLTARAADAFLEGMKAQGYETDCVFLPQVKIERCRQCNDDGWGICRTEGKCIIEDDFAGIVEKIRDSTAALFATPVYFHELSESLDAFFQRFRRICVNENGKIGIAGKAAVGISLAGGGGGGAPECAAVLEKMVLKCGFDVVDMIPVRRQNLDMKLQIIRSTGEWLAKGTGDDN